MSGIRAILGKRRSPFETFDKLYSEGKYREAGNEIETLLAQNSSSAWHYYKQALLLTRTGQLARATSALNRALELGNNDADLVTKGAKIRAVIADKQAVAEAAVSSLLGQDSLAYRELDPDRINESRGNLPYPAWQRVELLQSVANQRVTALEMLVKAAYQTRDYENLLEGLIEIETYRPLREHELLWGAEAEYSLREDTEFPWLDKINGLRRKSRRSEWILPDLLLAIGRPSDAADELERSQDSVSWGAKRWSFMSDIQAKMGQMVKASEAALVASFLDPKLSRSKKAAALAFMALNKGVAVEQAALAVQHDPLESGALRLLVHAQRAKGIDPKTSIKHAEPSWVRFDVDGTLRERLGVTTEEVKEDSKTIVRSFGKESVQRVAEHLGDGWFELRFVSYLHERDITQAKDYATRAVFQMEGFNSSPYEALAYCLAVEGRYDLAVAFYLASQRVPTPSTYLLRGSSPSRVEVKRYIELLDLLPVDPNLYLWESHLGQRIDCNPLALYREATANEKDKSWHVWTVDPGVDVPSDVKNHPRTVLVSRGSTGYWLALATAGFLVNNVTFPFEFVKREGQVSVNTWHGTPLKYLGRDDKESVFDYGNVSRNLIHSSILALPNEHTAFVMTERYDVAHLLDAELMIAGSPRNDVLVDSEQKSRNQLRTQLGIPDDGLPLVLYAPTWRGNSKVQSFDVDQLKSDLEALGNVDSVHVVFRGHPLSEAALADAELPVATADGAISTYELMAGSDIVITDYSSLGVDFLATGRPVVFYVHDWEEYSRDRGLYFSKEELPGKVASSITELIEVMQSLLDGEVETPEEKAQKQNLAGSEDGEAARRILNRMRRMQSDAAHPEVRDPNGDRRRMLVHHPLTDSASVEDMIKALNRIDPETWDVTLLFDHLNFRSDPTMVDAIGRLPAFVKVLPRKGAFLADVKGEFAIDTLYGPGMGVLTEQLRDYYLQSVKREAYRLLRDNEFDVAIEWAGRSPLWTAMLGFGVSAKKRVLIAQTSQEELPNEAHKAQQFWDLYDTIVVPSKAVADQLLQQKRCDADASVVVQPVVSKKIIDRDSGNVPMTERQKGTYYRGPLSKDFSVEAVSSVLSASEVVHADAPLRIIGSGPRLRDLLPLADGTNVTVSQVDWAFDNFEPAGSVYLEPLSRGPLGPGAISALLMGVPVVTLSRSEVADLADMEIPGLWIVEKDHIFDALREAQSWDSNSDTTSVLTDARGEWITTVGEVEEK